MDDCSRCSKIICAQIVVGRPNGLWAGRFPLEFEVSEMSIPLFSFLFVFMPLCLQRPAHGDQISKTIDY